VRIERVPGHNPHDRSVDSAAASWYKQRAHAGVARDQGRIRAHDANANGNIGGNAHGRPGVPPRQVRDWRHFVFSKKKKKKKKVIFVRTRGCSVVIFVSQLDPIPISLAPVFSSSGRKELFI
jgi:hypothetical protein